MYTVHGNSKDNTTDNTTDNKCDSNYRKDIMNAPNHVTISPSSPTIIRNNNAYIPTTHQSSHIATTIRTETNHCTICCWQKRANSRGENRTVGKQGRGIIAQLENRGEVNISGECEIGGEENIGGAPVIRGEGNHSYPNAPPIQSCTVQRYCIIQSFNNNNNTNSNNNTLERL